MATSVLHLAILLLIVLNQCVSNAAPTVPSECSQGGVLSINSGGDLLFGTVQFLFNLLEIGSGAPKPCAPTGVTSNVTSNSLLQATLNLVTDVVVSLADDMSVSGVFLSSDSAQRAASASAKIDLDGCASCSIVHGPLSYLHIASSGSLYAANGFSVQQGGELRVSGLLSGASVRGDRAYPLQNEPILILPSSSLVVSGMSARMNRGASVSVSGSLSVQAASKLVADSSTLSLQSGSNNVVAGTLQMLNGRLAVNGATLSVSSGGLVLLSGSTSLNSAGEALFTLASLGNFTVDIGASVNASDSTLRINQASTASSTFSGSVSSRGLTVSGGFFTLSGGVTAESSLLDGLTSASITGSLTSQRTLIKSTNSFLAGILSSSNVTLDATTSLSVLSAGSLVSSVLQVNPEATLQLGGAARVGNFLQLGGQVSLNGQALVDSATIIGAGILNSLGGVLNVSASVSLSESASVSASTSADLIIAGSLTASLRSRLALEQSSLRIGAGISLATNSSFSAKLGSAISVGAQLALLGNSSVLLEGSSLVVQTSVTLSDRAALVVNANAQTSSGSVSLNTGSTLAVLDTSVSTSTSLVVSGGSQILVGLTGHLSVSNAISLANSSVQLYGRLSGTALKAESSTLLSGSQATVDLERIDVVGGVVSLQGISTVNSSLSATSGTIITVLGSLVSTNSSSTIAISDSSLRVAASGSVIFGSVSATGASDIQIDGSATFQRVASFASSTTVRVAGVLEADSIDISSGSFNLQRSGTLRGRQLTLAQGTHDLLGTVDCQFVTLGSETRFPSDGSSADVKSQNITVTEDGSASGNMNGSDSSFKNDGQVGSNSTSTNITAGSYEQSSSGSMETTVAGNSSSSTMVYANTAQVRGTLLLTTATTPAVGSQYTIVQCNSNCEGSFDQIVTAPPANGGAATLSCEWKQTTSTKSIAVLFVGSQGCSDSTNGNGSTASDAWRNIIAIVVPCAIVAIAFIATAIVMSNPAWRIKAMPFLIRRNPAKYAKYVSGSVSPSNSQDPLVD